MSRPVVLITGASRGIGASRAARSRSKWDVVLAARDAEKLAKVQKAVESHGVKALCVATDLANTSQIDRLFEQLTATFWRPRRTDQ